MSTITIAGRDIELHTRPKHAAVVKVQNLMTDWLMNRIDTSNMDSKIPIEVALQQAVISDSSLTQKVTEMQKTLEIDQTIMLATCMEYQELSALISTAYEDEYFELYEASKDIMGATSTDFFEAYTLSMSLTKLLLKKAEVEEYLKQLQLKISTNQPNDS